MSGKLTAMTELEKRLYVALKQISLYDTPAQIKRHSREAYGCDADEVIEMAYCNVRDLAKQAIRGVKVQS